MMIKMAKETERKETFDCPDLICGDNKTSRALSDNLKVNSHGENSSLLMLRSNIESTNSITRARAKESDRKSTTTVQLKHIDDKNSLEQLTVDTGIALMDKRRINKIDCENTWKQMNVLAVEAATQRWHWPPYLLVLSVIIMITSHTLHCLVIVLEKSIPQVRTFQAFLWNMAQEYHARDIDRKKRMPTILLVTAASLAYVAYMGLYCLHLVITWFIEPLWSVDVTKAMRDNKTRSDVTFCASQAGDMAGKRENSQEVEEI